MIIRRIPCKWRMENNEKSICFWKEWFRVNRLPNIQPKKHLIRPNYFVFSPRVAHQIHGCHKMWFKGELGGVSWVDQGSRNFQPWYSVLKCITLNFVRVPCFGIHCNYTRSWLLLHCRCPENLMTIYPADVVLFEGILVFYFPAIRDLFHMKLFVDTDSDTRLARRGK